jgi:hypothetical protein
MSVNGDKSNVVYFRTISCVLTNHVFSIGSTMIPFAHSYKYLGVILNEFLNFAEIAKSLQEEHLVLLFPNVKLLVAFSSLPLQNFMIPLSGLLLAMQPRYGEISHIRV